MELVKLNVGGTVFEISRKVLSKFPDTLLGQLSTTSHFYNKEKEAYFFDRNPEFFNHVLDLYRTDTLHLPNHICGNSFKKELEYWKISPVHIGECCLNELFKYEREQSRADYINKSFQYLDYTAKECKASPYKVYLRKVWLVLDQPLSSLPARIFNYLFMSVVILSMVSFALGSHPDFRERILSYQQLIWIRDNLDVEFFDNLNINNSKEVMFATTMTSRTLTNIDLFCMIFFTVELLLHFTSCPVKKKFFTYPLNVLDPILLFAMWTSFGFEKNLEAMIERKELTIFYQLMKAFVVFRLFRFFRLVKIYSGLKIILLTLYASAKELVLLLLAILIAAFFFASFVYYAEFREPDGFPTVLSGIWWAIITMTTVGYGDMSPVSSYGQCVGAACAFFGILIISMPIAVVSTNFFDFYKANAEREKLIKFKSDFNIDERSKILTVRPLSATNEIAPIRGIFKIPKSRRIASAMR